MKTMREKIEFILSEDRISVYQIVKDTGLTLSPVQRLRHGHSNIDNIKLPTAEKLAAYYDAKEDEWRAAGYMKDE